MDDLTVARRAYIRVLERGFRHGLELLGALKDVEQAERALEQVKQGLEEGSAQGELREITKALAGIRHALLNNCYLRGWQPGARVEGEAKPHAAIGPYTHYFLGMWHPPTPPQSPQELGCAAIVCTCLEELNDEGQVQQHWATGCFDWPEYETVPGWDLTSEPPIE